MTEVVASLALFFVGAGVGWWLRRRRSGVLHCVVAGAAVLGAPLLLIVVSNVLGSDTLGWIGGLSLVVMVLIAPLLAVGAIGGWLFAGHQRELDPSTGVDEAALHIPLEQPSVPADGRTSTSCAPAAASRWSAQRSLLVAMAGVASAFWVVIALGFRVNHQRVPAELAAGFAPALLILVTAIALGLRRARQSRGPLTPAPRAFRRLHRPTSTAMAEYTAWRAAMAIDPRRQRYAAMLDAGDVFWTPDRVEYDLDPRATTCCAHLAPVERAMRQSGVCVKLDSIGSVRAECRVDAAVLSQSFSLPDFVVYEEPHAYDRSMEDPPSAVLSCKACGSRAWVVHPAESASDTPVFPAV
ncbi:MAG: hypothetical protein ABIR62_04970 [Dokdonella sp.]|uniref:hypothetical protein n=1 Tax=Dokdonella sp. TaxID=2291710 RepID=UPI0032648629